MNESRPEVHVVDNPSAERYEAHVGTELAAILQYKVHGDHVAFTHAETDPRWEGKGVASRLAQLALDMTIDNGHFIVPQCPFIVSYIERHPHYRDYIDPARR